jgi:HEAT repeat protein
MNELLALLAGGDLRSDGRGDEVADVVTQNPALYPLLLEGLDEEDDVLRGRAAHALERVSRSRPELLLPDLPRLISLSLVDEVPMVRWHLAMIFGNLSLFPRETDRLVEALYALLGDESVFVRSWAIASLCLIGRDYPARRGEIIDSILPLVQDPSIAIRTRAKKALTVLEDGSALPAGWQKSQRI